MNNLVKVIAIVPVYNTEPYLGKCLDSLINQTLQEILILVINDGSPDNSQAIIDEYIQNHPQKIIGYQRPNEGCGKARNFGIEKALEMFGTNGNVYLSFVDSDDIVENEAFELMYQEAIRKDAEIVCADHRTYVRGEILYEKGFTGTDINDPNERILATNVVTTWNKIYHISLFTQIRYPAFIFEDVVTTPLLFRKAQKVSYLPMSLYNYIRHKGSMSDTDLKGDALKAVHYLLEYAMDHQDQIILKYLRRSLNFFIQEDFFVNYHDNE